MFLDSYFSGENLELIIPLMERNCQLLITLIGLVEISTVQAWARNDPLDGDPGRSPTAEGPRLVGAVASLSLVWSSTFSRDFTRVVLQLRACLVARK